MKSDPGHDFGNLFGYIKAITENVRSFFGDSQILKLSKCFFVDLPENMFIEIKNNILLKSILCFSVDSAHLLCDSPLNRSSV